MSELQKYTFLPWLRQGIVRNISETDTLGKAASTNIERAEISLSLNWNGQNTSKTAKLVGPGDILSISDKAILRTDPANESYDFESNYLPFVEFYEEDFPWRYTPATPNLENQERLRPWLALVVLKNDEFNIKPYNKPIPCFEITGNLSTILHPHDEHWAWAHVHFNPETNINDNTGLNLIISQINQKPDSALSRLLSSRKLEKNTRYTAFIIPAFETGRLVGIGEALTDASGAPIQAQHPSWGEVPGVSITKIRPTEFPFYKQWNFSTSDLGDFETLVKKLVPREMPPELGARKLDISETGFGISTSFSTTVNLEGALKPPTYASPEWPSSDPSNSLVNDETYVEDLRKVLNLQDSLGKDIANSISDNPFYSAAIEDDPIVTPPLYGQWHALKSKVDTLQNSWFEELNLHPAYRSVAGLGSQVVQNNQEEYMERAWNQIGEIEAANQKIRQAQMSMLVSERMFEKHLLQMDEDKRNQVSVPLFKKIKLNELNGSAYNGTVFKAFNDSVIPNASLDSGFRKINKSRSKIVRHLAKKSGTSSFEISEHAISKFNQEDLYAAGPQLPPSNSIPISGIETSLSSSSNPFFDSTLTNNATAVSNFISASLNNSVSPSVTYTPISEVIKNEITPTLTISRKINKRLKVINGASIVLGSSIKPIMAYPKIPDAMFEELKKVNYEYIVPNLGQYPNNTVTLLETNRKFIESYMLGLNHEMSRELLWREFPTDQRGSYFRQFWNVDDLTNINTIDGELDIKPIHTWGDSILGDNHTTRLQENPATGGKLVLLVRGDLLKKYPNTLIYAQKAESNNIVQNSETLEWEVNTANPRNLSPNEFRFPIFKAELEPDVTVVGFDLTETEARTVIDYNQTTGILGPNNNPGWFFVFRERPGQVRFGLDDNESLTSIGSSSTWDELDWKHLGGGNSPDVIQLHLDNLSIIPDVESINGNTTDDASWGKIQQIWPVYCIKTLCW
jgi:hypothetical protein